MVSLDSDAVNQKNLHCRDSEAAKEPVSPQPTAKTLTWSTVEKDATSINQVALHNRLKSQTARPLNERCAVKT